MLSSARWIPSFLTELTGLMAGITYFTVQRLLWTENRSHEEKFFCTYFLMKAARIKPSVRSHVWEETLSSAMLGRKALEQVAAWSFFCLASTPLFLLPMPSENQSWGSCSTALSPKHCDLRLCQKASDTISLFLLWGKKKIQLHLYLFSPKASWLSCCYVCNIRLRCI